MSTDTFKMWVIELRLLKVTYNQDTSALTHCELLKKIGMGKGNSAEEISQFYRELLELPWLSATLRSAIMREAGISPRKRKQDFEAGRTEVLRMQVKKRKAQMQAAKAHPREGIHEAAISDIAQQHGISVEALKKRLQRLKQG